MLQVLLQDLLQVLRHLLQDHHRLLVLRQVSSLTDIPTSRLGQCGLSSPDSDPLTTPCCPDQHPHRLGASLISEIINAMSQLLVLLQAKQAVPQSPAQLPAHLQARQSAAPVLEVLQQARLLPLLAPVLAQEQAHQLASQAAAQACQVLESAMLPLWAPLSLQAPSSLAAPLSQAQLQPLGQPLAQPLGQLLARLVLAVQPRWSAHMLAHSAQLQAQPHQAAQQVQRSLHQLPQALALAQVRLPAQDLPRPQCQVPPYHSLQGRLFYRPWHLARCLSVPCPMSHCSMPMSPKMHALWHTADMSINGTLFSCAC